MFTASLRTIIEHVIYVHQIYVRNPETDKNP